MIKINIAQKCDLDGKLIMKWRNDKMTRFNSFNNTIKTWSSFRNEYYDNYFDNIPLFAELDGIKIAFISFCYQNKKTLIVGINIAPKYRGIGLSYNILSTSIEYIKNNYKNINKLIAEIKTSNIPSIKLFTKCNFELVKTINKCNTEVNVYELYIKI